MRAWRQSLSRNAKWGTGAIDALSERLQVELPGLRGFSAMSIRYMRLFFEAWAPSPETQHLVSVEFGKTEIQHLASVEIDELRKCYLPSDTIRPLALGELELVPIGHVEEVEIRSQRTNYGWSRMPQRLMLTRKTLLGRENNNE